MEREGAWIWPSCLFFGSRKDLNRKDSRKATEQGESKEAW
jgi:hypothetical protein